MKVEAHIIAWNEEDIIHLTIKHYQKFCDRIIIYDNYSTDRTEEVALSHGCEVKKFGLHGVLDDDEYLKVKNHCWKQSKADWVIVCDADEILKANTFKLRLAQESGKTIFHTLGWNVFSHDMPIDNFFEITNGKEDGNYCKSVIFNPKHIKEINFKLGCHVSKPVGNVHYAQEKLMLFHYRNIGGPDRLVKRHAEYRPRMSERNRRLGLGCHYMFSDEQRIREWLGHYENCKPFLPGGF
jgi:glycosyltransferase involved in cell wall biosynthesis